MKIYKIEPGIISRNVGPFHNLLRNIPIYRSEKAYAIFQFINLLKFFANLWR